MGYNFKEVKDNTDIVAIVGRYVGLKKDGDEYIGRCPFHDEKTSSFKVNGKKGIFKCFGCGAGGDVIDFLVKYKYSVKEAIEICGGAILEADSPVKKARVTKSAPKWHMCKTEVRTHELKAPLTVSHHKHGLPSMAWPWLDADGLTVAYDLRFDVIDADTQLPKKEVLPYTFCENEAGDKKEWRWQAMDEPRLISNLPALVKDKSKKKIVVIVEGRKTQQGAEQLFNDKKIIVVTWPGGGKAVHKADWSVLHGRQVVIWQDHDYPGYQTTLELTELLQPHCPALQYIHNPADKPKGWDAWDAVAEGWNKDSMLKHLQHYLLKDPQELINDKEIKEPAEGSKLFIPAGFEVVPVAEPVQAADVYISFGEPAAGSEQIQVSAETLKANLGRLFAAHVGRSWNEDFTDEDTGNAITVQRHEALIRREEQLNDERMGMLLELGVLTIYLHPARAGGGGQRPPANYDDEDGADAANNLYYRFLGFINNDGKVQYCFYNNSNKTIIKLSANSMGKGANLLELAPLNYWQRFFPNKRDGVDVTAALNMLIKYSNTVGIFRPQRLRGRGAWLEGANVIVHSGDVLLVNGTETDLGDYHSKYIYEQGAPLGLTVGSPLKRSDANKILELCKMLDWEREVNAHLLAGWCVIAPMCGALKWRPHIWITGPAGSGKTWVLNKIVSSLLGNTALKVQGSTSEAGLRQALKRDAMPVLFDEAEGENQSDQNRMQSVLTLMRSASAEDGGNIIKGSSGGSADSYQIRSCFAFASIGMQISQQSDRTRVTVLGMVANPDHQERDSQFNKLLSEHTKILTDEYAMQLQARTIRMLPVILENARIFASAAASVLGQQRAGDQLGALLAGAYSLVSDKLIAFDKAVEWVATKDWKEEEELGETKDERVLFQHMMAHELRVEGGFTAYNRAIGELINLAAGFETDAHCAAPSAHMSLLRAGFKVETINAVTHIIISNSSPYIKNKMLKDTPWSKNHNKILARIPGATKEDAKRFGDGMISRAVSIPMTYFVN